MTGRDLIIYILENGLENEKVFDDGKVVGYITIDEAAAKLNVGPATIYAWITEHWIEHVVVGSRIYVPANIEHPITQAEVL